MTGTDAEVVGSLSLMIIWYTDIASKIVTAASVYNNFVKKQTSTGFRLISLSAISAYISLPF